MPTAGGYVPPASFMRGLRLQWRPMRRLLLLLLLAPAALPGERTYDQLLFDARTVEEDPAPVATPEDRFNEAYEILARAVKLSPERWEAYWRRGLNRCEMAVVVHALVQERIAFARAGGAPPEEVDNLTTRGKEFIGFCIRDAAHDFDMMLVNMRRKGRIDERKRLFSRAVLMYAARDFEKGPKGGPGATSAFLQLYRRTSPDTPLAKLCAEFLGRCYNMLGAQAFRSEDYKEAQQYWDKALTWARFPQTIRTVLTNKAGGYEMDNEFGRAEKVLRELIRREPNQPAHWKNLGLVLGFQNHLREALYCYAQARKLCFESPGREFRGRWHGNAWMRAAVIHGNLLEEDGDILLAWRLFLQYRKMFGDDYNFSLWFGDFCSNHGAYDLAWLYLSRARDIQPHCTVAYQSLLLVAPRTGGSRDEVKARIAQADKALDAARSRYNLRKVSPAVKRICGGLQDLADGGRSPSVGSHLTPDPLAAWDEDHPPAWVEKIAKERKPFVAWKPGDVEGARDKSPSPATPKSKAGAEGGWSLWVAAAVALLVVIAGLALLLRRLRARAA